MRTALPLIVVLACTATALGNGGQLTVVRDTQFNAPLMRVYIPAGFRLAEQNVAWPDINVAVPFNISYSLRSDSALIQRYASDYGAQIKVAMPMSIRTYFAIPVTENTPGFDTVVRVTGNNPQGFKVTRTSHVGSRNVGPNLVGDAGYIFYENNEQEGCVLVQMDYIVTEPSNIWVINRYGLLCNKGTLGQHWCDFMCHVWNSRLTAQGAQAQQLFVNTAIQMGMTAIAGAGERSRIIAECSQATSDTLMATWQNNNRITDAALSRWSDAYRGVEEFPLGNGTNVKLPVTSNNWWAGSNGTFVEAPPGGNPNSNQEPGVTYRPLQPAR
jgi:hypothetical protein